MSKWKRILFVLKQERQKEVMSKPYVNVMWNVWGMTLHCSKYLKKSLKLEEKKLLSLIDFSHCFHDASVWNTNTLADYLLCFCFLGA